MRKKQKLAPSRFGTLFMQADNGQPLSFARRPYLKTIIDTKWEKVIILSSRQAGKSTLLASIMLYLALIKPPFHQLYATAEYSQLEVFRNDRILPQLAKGRPLARYLSPKNTNNRRVLELSNHSKLYFRAVDRNPLSAQGLSVGNVLIDEEQAIRPASVYRTIETAAAYPGQARFYHCGTPESPRNPFSVAFLGSTQNKWQVTCEHCHKENPPLSINNIDLKKPYFFCVLCGKKTSPIQGRFVAQNPKGRYPGFHISRLMDPQAQYRNDSRTGILDKAEDYSQDQFITQVLGLPAGSDKQVFKWEDIVACCREEDMVNPETVPEVYRVRNSVASVDWAYNYMDGGKAYTIVAIWIKSSGGDGMQCIYMKRFVGLEYRDPQTVIQEIANLCSQFQVDILASDYMLGYQPCTQIKKALPHLGLAMIQYTGMSPYLDFNGTNRYFLNRTLSLDILANTIKRGDIIFPRCTEEVESILSDFLNQAEVYGADHGGKRYEQQGGPDDFIHCTNYALQMFRKHWGSPMIPMIL